MNVVTKRMHQSLHANVHHVLQWALAAKHAGAEQAKSETPRANLGQVTEVDEGNAGVLINVYQQGASCKGAINFERAARRLPFEVEVDFNAVVAATQGWVDSRNDPRRAILYGDGSELDFRTGRGAGGRRGRGCVPRRRGRRRLGRGRRGRRTGRRLTLGMNFTPGPRGWWP